MKGSMSFLRKNKSFVIAPLVLAIYLSVLIFLFMNRFYIELPDGYYMWLSDIGIIIDLDVDHSLMLKKIRGRSSMMRVGPNVDKYRVLSNIIIGHVSLPYESTNPDNYLKDQITGKEGYFIIDYNKQEIYKDMSLNDWEKRLKNFGINYELPLYKPSRYDGYNGHNKP